MALISHYWIKPFFLDLQAKLTKKQMAETEMGDEVYEYRFMLKLKHVVILIAVTLILPLIIAILVLNSFGNKIDDDFKEEVVL